MENCSRTIAVASRIFIAAGFCFCGGASMRATTITLDAANSGYYDYWGVTSQSVGQGGNICMQGPGPSRRTSGMTDFHHDWLAFDLSGISGKIVGATLSLASDARNDSGQLIKWWDVSTSYDRLGNLDNTAFTHIEGRDIFADLGSGTLFGQGTHHAGQINTFVLNTDALASLNLDHSMWVIGGQNTQPQDGSPNFAFGYRKGLSPTNPLQLILDIEPVNAPDAGSSSIMLALGCVAIGALKKSRRL